MLLLLACDGVVKDASDDRGGRGCRSSSPNGSWECPLTAAELLLLPMLLLMLLLMLLRLLP